MSKLLTPEELNVCISWLNSGAERSTLSATAGIHSHIQALSKENEQLKKEIRDVHWAVKLNHLEACGCYCGPAAGEQGECDQHKAQRLQLVSAQNQLEHNRFNVDRALNTVASYKKACRLGDETIKEIAWALDTIYREYVIDGIDRNQDRWDRLVKAFKLAKKVLNEDN